MRARLETAEVSLAATISQVFGQVLRPVVTRDTSLGYEARELIARIAASSTAFPKDRIPCA